MTAAERVVEATDVTGWERGFALVPVGARAVEQLELFTVEDLGDAIPDRLVGSYFVG